MEPHLALVFRRDKRFRLGLTCMSLHDNKLVLRDEQCMGCVLC